MRRILCVILGLGTISLAISTHAPVQYVPLGSKVTIPCDGYGERRTGKWLHRNEDNEFTIIVHEMLGYIFRSKHLSTRKKIIKNFTLEISSFTELDKGTYVCQVCKSKKCTNGKPITLLPQFDISSTLFVKEDDRFSYSCLYNLTRKADWRFKALGENTTISVNREFTNKNVLFIPDVQPTNAGKYSYWVKTSTEQQKRVCSLTLCVLSVNAEKLTDSPQNCTLYCDADMDADEGHLVAVGKDKWNISVTGRVNKPKSSLSCRLLSNVGDKHNFGLQDATATQSYAISSITADNSSHFPVAALITTSTAFFFIVMIAIFILLHVLRQRADRNSRSANGHSEGEIESQVIYSTLQIGRYKQQNVVTSDTECVYSQIIVSNSI